MKSFGGITLRQEKRKILANDTILSFDILKQTNIILILIVNISVNLILQQRQEDMKKKNIMMLAAK